jgi:hypothetical protein
VLTRVYWNWQPVVKIMCGFYVSVTRLLVIIAMRAIIEVDRCEINLLQCIADFN